MREWPCRALLRKFGFTNLWNTPAAYSDLSSPLVRVSMSQTQHHSTLSRRSPDGVSGAWWLAHWLLVLVVALDFLSAPFHHHHHDGVEEPAGFATAHAAFDVSGTQVERDEHPPGSHATMAIRIDPSRLAQLPPIDKGDAHIVLVSVAQGLAMADARPPHHWRPDRSRPDVRSHRSLPPAGRAPPLHV